MLPPTGPSRFLGIIVSDSFPGLLNICRFEFIEGDYLSR
jgi:hypothetical protein